MKKKLGTKEYDTETATAVSSYVYGNWGDPDGYEEVLYCTPDGFYFVWGRGGSDSPYPTETMRRVAKTNVEQITEKHSR